MCVSHAFVTGVYLGDAFEVPQHLLGQTFYAAVVLKVKKHIQFSYVECVSF